MGLQSFFKSEKDEQWKSLKLAAGVSLGIIVLLFVAKSMFDFTGPYDAQMQQMFSQAQGSDAFGSGFVEALREDRKSMYNGDLLRSGFLILVTAGLLWLHVKNKLSQTFAVILVGLFMIGDLFFIDKNYVDSTGFVSAREVNEPFQPTHSDLQILKDTTQYRVYEIAGRLQARTSYFHKSLSGYSAVRPRRIEQLFDYQIGKNNLNVLNMLNTKYVIQVDEKGQEYPIINPDANGNAWFVKEVKFVNTPDEEMKALDKLDTKNQAVFNQKDFKNPISKTYQKDSTATIVLNSYKPNHLKYTSNNANKGLAVFSEIYYPKGWKVTIDGKAVEHFRVDYTLRGLEVPAGKHTIEFKFEPQVVKTGSTITLISSILMLLLLAGGIYFENKRKKSEPKN
ncbi:Bacterial membrane protein YfhO [compost metagenome]